MVVVEEGIERRTHRPIRFYKSISLATSASQTQVRSRGEAQHRLIPDSRFEARLASPTLYSLIAVESADPR